MTTAQSDTHDEPSRDTRRPRAAQQSHSIFSVPTPIKQLFDRFPLLSYPSNDLPLRAPANRNAHVLHVFSTDKGALAGAPSYNPACLKWQAYLKFCGIDFKLQASNNHASPSGALPFLIPATASGTSAGKESKSLGLSVVPSNKLQKWGMQNCGEGQAIQEPGDFRYEAYLSLVDLNVRRAWLYTLYLSPNFSTLAEPLYILPTSTNPLVRLSTASTLQSAAAAELLKTSAVINADELHRQADEAFAALEMLLGDNEWFFGAEKPGLWDASVFAYTHLLLDERLSGVEGCWVDSRVRDLVRARKGLVGHRERILKGWF
ncbi:unnamed protein product [Periconia digitata]|uniref:Mitochondrial outer membrane protein n=1 Tax=Periconia digitata TaxID=1303443 RepID=A0A9W4XU95_9PLEO|nr:unnamed protein product [Periconia digitata]